MNKNSGIKHFFKDSMIYIPCKVLEGLLGFWTIVYYTRLFPPDEYGSYSLIVTGIAFAATLATGWYSQSAVRYYDEWKENTQFYTSLTISWLSVNTVTVLCIVIGAVFVSDARIHDDVWLIALLFVSTNTFAVLQSLLRASRKALTYSVLSAGTMLIRFSLTLFLATSFDIGIRAILISTLITDLIAIAIAMLRLRLTRRISLRNMSIADYKPFIRKFAHYGVPLIGVHLVSYVLAISDRYILAAFRDLTEVGVYTFAYNLVQSPLALIIQSIMVSAFPIIIQTWNHKPQQETEQLLSRLVTIYLAFMVPAVFGIAVIGGQILKVMADPEYWEGYRILPWVTLGILFMGLTQYSNKIFELTERTKSIFHLSLIAAVSKVVLNIVLIPLFGYVAAGVTTMLCYLLYFILSLYMSRKSFRFRIEWRAVIKMIAASAAMYGFLYAMTGFMQSLWFLLLAVFSGAAVYFSLLLVMGVGREEAVSLMNKIKGGIAGRKSAAKLN